MSYVRLLSVALVLVATGCFSPDYNNHVECGASGECPGSQICATDNRCYDPDDLPGDAPNDLPDAAPDAAPDCADGYAEDQGSCVDVNECLTSDNTCATDATCANEPGSYSCACNTGFVGDGQTCDPDGCLTAGLACDAAATCVATANTYSCQCTSGFTGDGQTCADIDECTTSSHNCDANAACTNTPGSFTCACTTGYAGNGTSCVDDDGCVGVTCFQAATCSDTPAPGTGFSCPACPGGYTGSDGVVCTDIDECASNPCVANAHCENTAGSYTCECECEPGYLDQGGACNSAPFASISAGAYHTCAVRGDGSLWCWGTNVDQQLGLGVSLPNRGIDVPIQVGRDRDWVQVSSGTYLTCGLRRTGDISTAYCWGYSYTGSAGRGSTWASPVPDRVGTEASGTVFTDWAELSVGSSHTCGRRSDGSIWCWGGNDAGQLGNSNNTDQHVPSQVVTPNDGEVWTSVRSGQRHNCATRSDGGVWCWGYNFNGQLGNGAKETTEANRNVPTSIGSTGWAEVSTGAYHTCARRAEPKQIYCWGSGQDALGRGNVASPVQVGTASNWESVASGSSFNCATDSVGQITCWGTNRSGQMGDGTTFGEVQTTTLAGVGWDKLSLGQEFMCATKVSGELWCWGSNSYGQLGSGVTGLNLSPESVRADPSWGGTSWVSATSGSSSTCGVRSDGTRWCWGGNVRRELGDGTTSARQEPTEGPETTPDWKSIALGGSHGCGIQGSGGTATMWCWGSNASGVFGNGEGGDGLGSHNSSVPVQAPESGWTQVAAGQSQTCGIRDTERLHCWGRNAQGQNGDGTKNSRNTIGSSIGSANWSAVAAGFDHTCGIQSDGKLYCWGANSYGALGDGTTAEQLSPAQIGTANWSSVAAGFWSTCAIQTDGSLHCWGYNNDGQLGLGTLVETSTPTRVGFASDWSSVSVGQSHACGIRESSGNRTLWCWGANRSGQLGAGTTVNAWSEDAPVRVGTLSDWTDVYAGSTHTCGLRSNGVLYCWGENISGQLGDGSAWIASPSLVVQ